MHLYTRNLYNENQNIMEYHLQNVIPSFPAHPIISLYMTPIVDACRPYT